MKRRSLPAAAPSLPAAASPVPPVARKYRMKISRLTVDKLGVKLYDKVSGVIAELLSNCYDADATRVTVSAPMGEYLASARADGALQDAGHEIVVSDDGVGMTQDEMQAFFLVIGTDRRQDAKRGDLSRTFKRKVMGRKGVGKLAPFGICRQIEVLSSGGDLVSRMAPGGGSQQGYLTSHIVLNYDGILADGDGDYEPATGSEDGTLRASRGTRITLRAFHKRKVPEMEVLARQIAQRFGIKTANWQVELEDTTKTKGSPERRRDVGGFDIAQMAGTRIEFVGPDGPTLSLSGAHGYSARNPDGTAAAGIEPGFTHEGRFYPVKGWLAYAKESYRDDLMAGVRVYCRGKIATQTLLFNKGSGFEGEYSIRSYFVGELSCDWLDEGDDLIRTDRLDILWSDDLGQAFQEWGQRLVVEVGKRARNPMRERTRDIFREVSKIVDRAAAAFPQPEQKDIRNRAVQIADLLGSALRGEEARDTDVVDPLVSLSIDLAPHLILEEKLREAANAAETPIGAISSILRTAQLAELYSFGRIAHDRVRVIEQLEALKDAPGTDEAALQALIESAPWLIDPQWAPITANQSLRTLRAEFEKWFLKETGTDIALRDFSETKKRPDFVTFSVGERLHIVEIKKPHHKFANDEMDRLDTYYREMDDFLNDPAHGAIRERFRAFHITLVCDDLALKGVARTAFEKLREGGDLTHRTWADFLVRTRNAHNEFLAEAQRQKTDAARRA